MTRDLSLYLKPIKSKSVDKVSSMSGGRAGGWTAESRHVPSQGRFLVPVPSPHSPSSTSPADATPGEISPGEAVRHFFALCRFTYSE
ncbi:hypothetical protein ACSS6W_009060 [Trichoderma asperelloides]